MDLTDVDANGGQSCSILATVNHGANRPVGSLDGQRSWALIASVLEAKLAACALTSCVLRQKAISLSLTRHAFFDYDFLNKSYDLLKILFALHLEYKDKWNTCVRKQDAAEYETSQSHTKVLLIQTLTERYLVFRIRYVYLQIFSANVAHIAGLWITGCHGCAQGNAIYKGLGRIPIWRFLDIFLLPRY